jgi:tRNA nucleotidyltransferase (CCA-adding enzyme)
MIEFTFNDELKTLRQAFNARGFEIRLVGGAVRDIITGITPKDLDFCTDANPDEQRKIYIANGFRFVETGLQHGTITVVMDSVPYEITSLRTESNHDGRHATVAYTNDWLKDLERRDFTINAMALTFDGKVIDPFGGQQDLAKGIVRFVGNAEDRIREDYLRIMRWFRFYGRFGNDFANDDETYETLMRFSRGLQKISRERIWSELKKIVCLPTGHLLVGSMTTYIFNHIGLDTYWSDAACKEAAKVCSDPEVLMAAGYRFSETRTTWMADALKWSNEERAHVTWLCDHVNTNSDPRRLIAVDGAKREWVREMLLLEGKEPWIADVLLSWEFKPFPVTGNDLIATGRKPGPAIGYMLRHLKNEWANSNYIATKEELLAGTAWREYED